MALSDVHLMLGPSQDCLGGNHVACDGAESQTSRWGLGMPGSTVTPPARC